MVSPVTEHVLIQRKFLFRSPKHLIRLRFRWLEESFTDYIKDFKRIASALNLIGDKLSHMASYPQIHKIKFSKTILVLIIHILPTTKNQPNKLVK